MRTQQVKDSDLKKEWKRIDEALISPELLHEMPQPECTALTLLVDAMINSTVCELGPGQGQITAKVGDGIYILLDVEETVRNRIEEVYPPTPFRAEIHDGTVVQARNYPPHGAETVMDICIINRENGCKFDACVHGPKASIPALDDCASFVYWAEAGFPNPPTTISDAVSHALDPRGWEAMESIRARNLREARHLESMRRDLAIEEMRATQRIEEDAEIERQRIMSLGWRGLIDEHRRNGLPITGDDVLEGRRSDISHMLRESLLDPDAQARARIKDREAKDQENLQQQRFYRIASSRRNENEQNRRNENE
jgi:hypothetical protein